MHDYMYESLQKVLALLTYEINCLMNGQDGEKPINNIKQSLLALEQEVVARGLKKKKERKKMILRTLTTYTLFIYYIQQNCLWNHLKIRILEFYFRLNFAVLRIMPTFLLSFTMILICLPVYPTNHLKPMD